MTAKPRLAPAFAHVRDWVFDLDNTLYPADLTVYDAIGARMTAFIQRLTGQDADQAMALREDYFHRYGATVVGLVRHHGVEAIDFLDAVHDVDLSDVRPAPHLAAQIARLPGRAFVFTNGARAYALRVLERLGLSDALAGVAAIEDLGLAPKPQTEAFQRMAALFAIDPGRAAMFEDHEANLDAAGALGFATVLVGPASRRRHEFDAASAAPHRRHTLLAPDIHAALATILAG